MSEDVYTGKIKRVVFTKDDFYILLVENGARETFVCKGKIINPKLGDELEFYGSWEVYKGEKQFKFSAAIAALPTNRSGLIGYLKQLCGEGTALEVLLTFKEEDVLKILDEEPTKLLDVKGIGHIRLQKIMDRHKNMLGNREAILFFKQFDLSMTLIDKIVTTFGKDAKQKFSDNPYILTQVKGIGFETADKIARKTGIDNTDPRRIRAGVMFALTQGVDNGHCYLPLGILSRSCEELLQVSGEYVIDAMYISQIIEQMINDTLIAQIVTPEEDCIYLPFLLGTEQNVAKQALGLLQNTRKVSFDVDVAIENVQKSLNVEYASQQKEFLRQGLLQQFLILTGGPGTGKTTALKGLLALFDKAFPNDTIALCAPTGKASKRMTESTGREAKTIHRLLEFEPSGKFKYNEFNKLPVQIVVVDEVSMLDIFLTNNLLKAVEKSTKLIFVGDTDQLPSVGAGAVLRDLLDSAVIPSVKLTEIFRQAQDSGIVMNAYAVNHGEYPKIKTEKKDFIHVPCESEHIQEKVRDWVFQLSCLYEKEEIQVLTPIKQKKIGVGELNPLLQELLNQRLNENEITVTSGKGSILFREGDKVMQMRNNYELNVFNGDSGIIKRIEKVKDDDGELQDVITVDFDGQEVDYTVKDASELSLSYACTIHKSQGSEWKAVIIPISFDAFTLLKRNLLYTAITRAKEVCIVIGDQKAIAKTVKTLDTELRFTQLKRWLQKQV